MVFTEAIRIVLPSGDFMVVTTVVPLGIDGSETATALPLEIVSALLPVERVNLVVGVFLGAIAR